MSEEFYQVSKLETEFMVQLRNRTITAILAISIAYLIALILLVVTLLKFQTSYCFIVFVIPLLVYLWLITYGGVKHVNNHYKLIQIPGDILLCKKRRVNYTSFIWVLILVFYVSSMIRLICEIRNLKIINAELISRSN